MAGVNKVILVGNLGADPEVRYMPNGNAVANVRIATSENWTDKQTGQKQERTEWHRVVMFRRLGEIAGQYLRKGSKIYIEGKLQTRKWQAQDGTDRWSTEIVANEMQMLDSRGATQQDGYNPAPPMGADNFSQPQQTPPPTSAPQNNAPPAAQNTATPQAKAFEDFDDDVPF